MEDIEEIWRVLSFDAEKKDSKGIVRRLLNPAGLCPIYAGVRSPDNAKMFFFIVDNKFLPSKERFLKTRAIEIISGEITDDNTSAVCLVLNDELFLEFFSILTVDLIKEIETETDEKKAVDKFIMRINSWTSFFEEYGDKGLSPQRVRGLFGELWFLRNYLLNPDNGYIKIKNWTGPEGSPHDFQFGKIAVEVKTTATKKPWKINISNEIQLDDFGLEHLFLYHLALRETEDGSLTLPHLVMEIEEFIIENPETLRIFRDKLFNLGYIDSQKENYCHKGFIISEENFYIVSESFPRITKKDMSEGTGDLSYSVSLSAAENSLVEKEELVKLLGNF